MSTLNEIEKYIDIEENRIRDLKIKKSSIELKLKDSKDRLQILKTQQKAYEKISKTTYITGEFIENGKLVIKYESKDGNKGQMTLNDITRKE